MRRFAPLTLLVILAVMLCHASRTAAAPRHSVWTLLFTGALAAVPAALPGTRPLETQGDLAAHMVEGIDRYLTRETAVAAGQRGQYWKRDLSSPEAYAASVRPNRERLREILGVVDARVPFSDLELVSSLSGSAQVGRGHGFRILRVRWPVLPGVDGEGLLLEPEGRPTANLVALGDCDWTPEMLAGLEPGVPEAAQFARRLAESGCRVLVPMLIDRKDTYSGNPSIRMTNQPGREWVYRGAFEMGRHVIGYEVQKVLAAVDWFAHDSRSPQLRTGVMGYGEGGLLALYSAAVDERIQAAVVGGYFGPREGLWHEPIYRNVFGLLREFGDAELASLVAPRPLVVEACTGPEIGGPPPQRNGRSGAAPGVIAAPKLADVKAEVERARAFTRELKPEPATVALSGDGAGQPGAAETLSRLLKELDSRHGLGESHPVTREGTGDLGTESRQKRQVEQLVEFTQRVMRDSPARREQLWSGADRSSVAAWERTTEPLRQRMWKEVIGQLPAPDAGAGNPRSRLIYDEPTYRGYEVVLDVWPDVFAYGILLVPKDIKEGERRPVVVCQHGLEGRPSDAADPKSDNHFYHRFAGRLAEQGYVTFSPQNPYIFGDRFRLLQRKANPLGASMFSVIVRQHERILQWLASQPFVDPKRIGFYGLSYGGKTAMRVPALLPGYCLSICAGDFNEWIWKNVSSTSAYSYVYTGEWEMPEWNLGNTFNYAEMSGLICPRPFMVERGHGDGVAPDEWVAYEFAKTRRTYDALGIGDRTEIEFFNGPHTIHGVGTFAFLHRHLGDPHH